MSYAGKNYSIIGPIVAMTSNQKRPYRVVTVEGEEYEPWPHMLSLVSRKIHCNKEVSSAGTES